MGRRREGTFRKISVKKVDDIGVSFQSLQTFNFSNACERDLGERYKISIKGRGREKRKKRRGEKGKTNPIPLFWEIL